MKRSKKVTSRRFERNRQAFWRYFFPSFFHFLKFDFYHCTKFYAVSFFFSVVFFYNGKEIKKKKFTNFYNYYTQQLSFSIIKKKLFLFFCLSSFLGCFLIFSKPKLKKKKEVITVAKEKRKYVKVFFCIKNGFYFFIFVLKISLLFFSSSHSEI